MPAHRHCLVLLTILLLTACTSRGLETELTNCTYPDSTRTPAPSFICSEQMEGYPVTRLVSVPDSGASTQERIEQGRMQAQRNLANAWLDDWFPELQPSDREAAQKILTDWLQQELRVIRTRTSPTETLWLLVGISQTPALIRNQMRSRLRAAGLLPA